MINGEFDHHDNASMKDIRSLYATMKAELTAPPYELHSVSPSKTDDILYERVHVVFCAPMYPKRPHRPAELTWNRALPVGAG